MTTPKRPLIVWSDPPPEARRGRPAKYGQHVDALKERPGQWACLKRSEDPRSLEGMRTTLYSPVYRKRVAPLRLQLRIRQTAGGDWGLWARITTDSGYQRKDRT